MNKPLLSVCCCVLGLCLLFWPDGSGEKPVPPEPIAPDLVAQAFASYEQLWRKLAKDTADKLAAGELKTDRDVWDVLASGQEAMRKIAFEAVAKQEQAYFAEQNGWTAEGHEKLLRSYTR